ncbi:hypothetical protein LWI28_014744 [Acer negundo]|uniref:CCHC-type domain-containing protein n=1 Tax=Acer negundo TaxID=4023 RepID=A0AAD5IF84_ACENE|nr:hypothetical protein LWI28_014744 [Acer negundo]
MEKTITRWGGGGLLTVNRSGTTVRSGTSSDSVTNRAAVGNSSVVLSPVANPNQQPRSLSGLGCFSYGEAGHRQSECKKLDKKRMFTETDEGEDRGADIGAELQFEEEEEVHEELVDGVVGPILMSNEKETQNSKGVAVKQGTTMVVMVLLALAAITDVDEYVVDERVEVPTELPSDEKETQNSKGVAIELLRMVG